MITRTFIAYHLGDHLIHLNFLRRVAKENPNIHFVHHAANQYIEQLQAVIKDVPNIGLAQYDWNTPPDAIDAWRGVNGYWYAHPNRDNFVEFHFDWFDRLAKQMDVKNPVKKPEDMLFDYPAIQETVPHIPTPFDVLVINAPPGSGQFRDFTEAELLHSAVKMAKNGKKVVITSYLPEPTENLYSTKDPYLSVTQIGQLSLHCHTLLMVSTGPSWPTFNIWNLETIKRRILLLNTERVWLAPNMLHCESVGMANEILRHASLL